MMFKTLLLRVILLFGVIMLIGYNDALGQDSLKTKVNENYLAVLSADLLTWDSNNSNDQLIGLGLIQKFLVLPANIHIFLDMTYFSTLQKSFYDGVTTFTTGISFQSTPKDGLWFCADYGAGFAYVDLIENKERGPSSIASSFRFGVGYNSFGLSMNWRTIIGNNYYINLNSLGLVYYL